MVTCVPDTVCVKEQRLGGKFLSNSPNELKLPIPDIPKNMNGKQQTRAATFGRVDGYAKLHPEDFLAGKKAAELLMIIRQAEADTTDSGTTQATSDGDSRAGSQTKAELYDELYDDLRAINRTAKSMAHEMAGFDEKFRMPRTSGYGAVIIAARAFLADATPLKSVFLEYDLPEDFLTDLGADIAAFDAAEGDQGSGLTERVGATRELDEAIRAGTTALRRLDPIIKNKCRSDAGKLAQWITASHIERAPRKAAGVAVSVL